MCLVTHFSDLTHLLLFLFSKMAGMLWYETRNALAGIAEAAARYDTDGVDLYFLNSPKVGQGLRVSLAFSSLELPWLR